MLRSDILQLAAAYCAISKRSLVFVTIDGETRLCCSHIAYQSAFQIWMCYNSVIVQSNQIVYFSQLFSYTFHRKQVWFFSYDLFDCLLSLCWPRFSHVKARIIKESAHLTEPKPILMACKVINHRQYAPTQLEIRLQRDYSSRHIHSTHLCHFLFYYFS